LDVPAKVNGSARFGLDLEAPDMLYAAVRHGPAYGSTVTQIDDGKAKSMPGVRLVMAVPQGVAVVADQYWQAAKALAEVRETYASHPNSEASSATVELRRARIEQPGVPTMGSHGDVPAAMKSAENPGGGVFCHSCRTLAWSPWHALRGRRPRVVASTKSPSLMPPRGTRAYRRVIYRGSTNTRVAHFTDAPAWSTRPKRYRWRRRPRAVKVI
jgi:hypothetical protein